MDPNAPSSVAQVSRPGCITAYAILLWIGGGLSLLGALCAGASTLLRGSAFERTVGVTGNFTLALIGLLAAVAVGMMALLPVITGVGLWRMKNWTKHKFALRPPSCEAVLPGRRGLALLALCLVFSATVSGLPALAADSPSVTVVVKSAYLRSTPDFNAPHTYSVFQNQTYAIVSRTADNLWLQLDFAGATQGTWLAAEFGRVMGDLATAPVAPVGPPAPPAAASAAKVRASPSVAIPVWFTVTARSCFGLSAPDPQTAHVQSLFKGQVFRVRARTADLQWLKIDVTGANTDVWVWTANGTTRGDVAALPVAGAPPTPTPVAVPLPAEAAIGPTDYPVVPVVSPHAREIYQYGLTLGNSPRRFSKVGDCQAVTPYFLASFDNPADYRLGRQYAYLQATIDNFRRSFTRNSEAVQAGFNVASVLNPMWANPNRCRAGETPLECEFRIHRPSIVIISMETWWINTPASDYEAGLRQIVEFSINHGVVPILGTKADNAEKDGSLNAAIVRVAQAYDVPLWNFWLAVQPLPNHGLIPDGFHLTWGRAVFDDPANMQQKAWTWRNLTALQALDAVWQAVR